EHRGAGADGTVEETGDRLPAFGLVELDALGRGDHDDLGEQAAHEGAHLLMLVELMRLEAKQCRRRQRADVEGELLPYLGDDLCGRRRFDASLTERRHRRL